jgi:hypothetical protein
VTVEENAKLEEVFTEEEVKTTVFGSYLDGAPGPDGLNFSFYKKNWDLIKEDFMAMFCDLYEDKLDIYRLNFALIIIIQKEKGARTMNKFMPVSLLNCSYKIFTRWMIELLLATKQLSSRVDIF